MCVIAAKPAGVKWLDPKSMKNCFTNNRDGAGLAYVDGKGLHIEKGYFNWKRLWHDLKVLEDYPVLLHCRLATHGSISKNNCHPFLLKNGIAFAHNGVINGLAVQDDKTDSEIFGRKYIQNMSVDEIEKYNDLLSMAIGKGNKLAMLTSEGNFLFVNKEQGVEEGGIWFSNTSYINWYDRYRSRKTQNYCADDIYGWFDDYGLNDPFFADYKLPNLQGKKVG